MKWMVCESTQVLSVLIRGQSFRRDIHWSSSTGMEENPVLDLSSPSVKRGRRKQSKARNLLDRCRKFQN